MTEAKKINGPGVGKVLALVNIIGKKKCFISLLCITKSNNSVAQEKKVKANLNQYTFRKSIRHCYKYISEYLLLAPEKNGLVCLLTNKTDEKIKGSRK